MARLGKGRRGLFVLSLLGIGVVAAAFAVAEASGGRRTAPPAALDLLVSAKVAYAERDLPRAERLVREHLAARPEAVDARLLLGRVLLERGRAAEARDAFMEAKRLDPRNAEVLRGLGQACKALGEGDAAVRHLRAATEVKRDDPGLWRELGLAQRESGDTFGALTSIQKSLALDRDQPELAAALADLARGKPADPMAAPFSTRVDPLHPKPLDPRTIVPGPRVPDPSQHFPAPSRGGSR